MVPSAVPTARLKTFVPSLDQVALATSIKVIILEQYPLLALTLHGKWSIRPPCPAANRSTMFRLAAALARDEEGLSYI
jgi:hypothetical protein